MYCKYDMTMKKAAKVNITQTISRYNNKVGGLLHSERINNKYRSFLGSY